MPAQPIPNASNLFEAGVRLYRESGYVDLDFTPDPNRYVLTAFKIVPAPGTDLLEAAAAVAAESSTGTWTEVWSKTLTNLEEYNAIVYRIQGPVVSIAYPLVLFEEGSIVNVMSSIVGNVYGFKAVQTLKLLDIAFPAAYMTTFGGPNNGIEGVRDKMQIYERPLLGGTVKPKLGLSARAYATIVYESLVGGLDTTKDDENINSQPFNRWRDRLLFIAEAIQKAESDTGERKAHFFNVTAGSVEASLERLHAAADAGLRYIMYDYLTGGFAAFESVRQAAGKRGLMLHVHRAMHAVIDRHPDHGISFLTLAKWGRMHGADNLHTGTVVGKLEGRRAETVAIAKMLRERRFTPAEPENGILFDQEWVYMKNTFPVASGGIHILHVPDLIQIYGIDAFLLFGGGTHGHPRGSRGGGRANRAVVEAISKAYRSGDDVSICGPEIIRNLAKKTPEVQEALDVWGGVRFE
jgi:ribulose-bisphosphate carboxylase large chain